MLIFVQNRINRPIVNQSTKKSKRKYWHVGNNNPNLSSLLNLSRGQSFRTRLGYLPWQVPLRL